MTMSSILDINNTVKMSLKMCVEKILTHFRGKVNGVFFCTIDRAVDKETFILIVLNQEYLSFLKYSSTTLLIFIYFKTSKSFYEESSDTVGYLFVGNNFFLHEAIDTDTYNQTVPMYSTQ